MKLRKRIFFVLMSLFLILGIAACNSSADTVQISFAEDEYLIKEYGQLRLDVNIVAGSNYDADQIRKQLVFTSSDESIITVDETGIVTGVSIGVAEIKVEWSEKTIVFDKTSITVFKYDLPEVIFSEYSPNMLKGTSQTIGWEFDTVYTDAYVRWESANPEVAVVDENGKVTAVGAGEATIICYSTDGANEKAHIAKINVIETDYAINYVLNGGVNAESNPAGYNTLHTPVVLDAPSRVGYTFAGWFTDEACTVPFVEIAKDSMGDVTVYAAWDVVTYEISYDLAGGEVDGENAATYTVEDEVEFVAPTKYGYAFIGWVDAEGNKVEKIEKGTTGNVALTATWDVVDFTITYDLDGGENAEANPSTYTANDEIVFADATKLGYVFLGWYDAEGNKVEKLEIGTLGDVALTAKWEIVVYNISYELSGAANAETNVATYTVLDEVVFAAVEKDGYVFNGWVDAEGNKVEKLEIGTTGDVTVIADFEAIVYNISYELDGGANAEANPETYIVEDEIVFADATKLGYAFLGWYDAEGNKVEKIEKGTMGDINIAAKFEIVVYNITIVAADTEFTDTYTVLDEKVFAEINKVGYIYHGIYDAEGNKVEKIEVGTTGDIVLTAKLEAIVYEITYDLDGATNAESNPATYTIEDEVVFADIEKVGYTFLGWFDAEGNKVEKLEKGTINNIALAAKFETIKYNITYKFDDGVNAESNPATYTIEDEVVFAAPTKDNYNFVCWVDVLGNKVEKIEKGSIGDVELIATWDLQSFAITYVLNEGTLSEGAPLEYYPAEGIKFEATASKAGHLFLGWSLTEGGEFVTELVKGTKGDITLYANFELIEFKLTYVLNDGVLPEDAPVVYLSTEGLKLDFAPVKVGYKFLGWSTSEGGAYVSEIAKGTKEDMTLYANFEVAVYNIEYVLNGGTFSVDEEAYIYDNFDQLVADFLNDYATKFGLSSLTVANFISKSNSYGIVNFFKDEALNTKWGWLKDYILTAQANYSGLTYMKNPAGAANYNKYWRANLAAFLQKTKVNSPVLSMDFSNVDTEAWWTVVPTKIVSVAANPKYTYTIFEVPFAIETPMREGVEFLGWCLDGKYRDVFTTLPEGTYGDITLYAKWSDTKEVYDEFKINYELNYGRFEGEVVDKYTETVGLNTLPTPVKVGYTFLGWTLETESTDYVTSIGTDVTGDVTLYAQWTEKESSLPKIIYVGAEREYKTLAEALEVALKGDTIVLDAGTYEGATVDKSVTIKGPNAGINPNTGVRKEEAIITGNLVIANDNIVIDGIQLTGAGKIKADATQSLDGLLLDNIYVLDSTANVGNISNTAPIDLNVNGSNVVSNVVLSNSKFATGDISNDRPMIMIATNIHNLAIINNNFVGKRVNYNDAVKLGNGASKGVTGSLVVSNNHFENYSQYLIWLCTYGAVDVLIENNTFLNNGQTAGSHGVIRFASYKGTTSDVVNCEMYRNTVDNSYMLLRVDAASNLTADNASFLCKYNSVINSKDSIFVKNSSTNASVVCDNNYWGVATLADSAFVNATHTNDLTDAADIPTEEDIWLEGKLIVGADATYKTIAEALAAANDGDEIYLTAGTYAEEVTIDKSVTIYGPNHGVHGNSERKEEAIITKLVTVAANNVVIDGVKFTEEGNIKVSANNVTITNIYMMPEKTIAGNGINRQACIVDGANISDLVISNSYINVPGDVNTYTKEYVAFNNVTNLTIDNNYITNRATTVTGSGSYEGSRIYTSAGVYNITNNVFHWATDGYVLYLANIKNVTELNIIDNVFDGNANVKHTATLALRTGSANTVTNIIGNEFYNFKGSSYVFNGDTGSTVNSMYNFFDAGTSFKIGTIASAKLNYESNGYAAAQTTETSDYGVLTTLEEVKSAYNAWKISQEVGDAEVYSNLYYELNGGTIEAGYDVKYLEGQKTALYAASKEGFKFLGWSIDEAGSKVYTEVQRDWTGDITLYAQFVEIFDVTYELDGGEVSDLVLSATNGTTINLPTPSKYGHVFLGWTLEQGSEEYIYSFKLTADTTVYANWIEATFYYINYELNGGSIKYASREALVNDFIADYSLLMNKSYVSGADIPTGAWSDIDYHTFFDKSFADGTTVRDKWLWLAQYLYELSVRDLASNNCNVLGLADLIDGGTFKSTGDNMYGLSYAFRAFLAGAVVRPDSSYVSVDHTNPENANGFWAALSAAEAKQYSYYKEETLPTASMGDYKFDGWYKNADFSGEKVTTVSHADDGITLYAKFIEATPVTSITIDNKVAEIKRFETLQLVWTINPTDANIQTVTFASSNPKVATIDDKGFIVALTEGTTTITITSKSSSGASDSFELVVYAPDHFDFSYETESYVEMDQNIQINAEYIKRDGTRLPVVWTSLTPEIAIVDANGKVTGLNKGLATIRATVEGTDVYQDFVVTVIDADQSAAMQEVLNAHESNTFVRYDLGIGAGTPAYYSDIFGSISKIFYNHKLEINEQYKAAGDASNDYYKDSNTTDGLEFITVHYTAGFDATADTDNHASYFTSGNADVSIHYVTGNAGSDGGQKTSEVYSTLSHNHGAWHAGDSNSRYYSNSTKKNADNELIFTWMPTGVAYDGADLVHINWSASDDFYYEINGKKTTIKLPTTYDYKSRYTNHIYNADGTISAQPQYDNWGTRFDNKPVEDFFNTQGFPVTVIDGQYYMGPTWWSYGQTYAGMICGSGGNRSSIGIESCVNNGSDLWYTWQVTAQLVASLMVQYNLDISRVKGHHFFDGKDCPQPMLENDLEIWWEFLELVKTEYELLTTFKDTTFEMKVDEAYTSVISENGRVIDQPEFSQVVTYTVTIKTGDVEETITLATAVEGMYNK